MYWDPPTHKISLSQKLCQQCTLYNRSSGECKTSIFTGVTYTVAYSSFCFTEQYQRKFNKFNISLGVINVYECVWTNVCCTWKKWSFQSIYLFLTVIGFSKLHKERNKSVKSCALYEDKLQFSTFVFAWICC